MAGAELVFNIFARDHASKVFKDIGKAASNLGKSFDKLQKGGKFAVIGGAAITAVPHSEETAPRCGWHTHGATVPQVDD